MSVCLFVTLFPKPWKPVQATSIPKSDLSTYVLYLIAYMTYLMSHDLQLMSYLMSYVSEYVIWSHGFGLRLAFRT